MDIGQQYIALATLRNGEARLRWARVQIFLLLNTSGLAVLPFIFTNLFAKTGSAISTLVISIAGLLISIIWIATNNKANKWIDFWNSKLSEIEATVSDREGSDSIRVFSSDEYRDADEKIPTYHFILSFFAVAFLLVWGLMFLVSVVFLVVNFDFNY